MALRMHPEKEYYDDKERKNTILAALDSHDARTVHCAFRHLQLKKEDLLCKTIEFQHFGHCHTATILELCNHNLFELTCKIHSIACAISSPRVLGMLTKKYKLEKTDFLPPLSDKQPFRYVVVSDEQLPVAEWFARRFKFSSDDIYPYAAMRAQLYEECKRNVANEVAKWLANKLKLKQEEMKISYATFHAIVDSARQTYSPSRWSAICDIIAENMDHAIAYFLSSGSALESLSLFTETADADSLARITSLLASQPVLQQPPTKKRRTT
jgi:hypothetical protein